MKKRILIILLVTAILVMPIFAGFAEEVEKTEETNITENVVITDEVKEIKEGKSLEDVGALIPVLMYHHIDEHVENDSIVSEEKFKSDMDVLKEHGYEPIFLSEIRDYLLGYYDLPDKPIVITFDDGYLSNYEIAYPILKELDFKANIAIIGWSVGRDIGLSNEKKILPHFTWKQGKEMVDSGLVEINNHTFDLHSPAGKSYGLGKSVAKGMLPLPNEDANQYKTRVTKDIMNLNIAIYHNIGSFPTFVTYPYGEYTSETEKALHDIGITGTLTTKCGVRRYLSMKDLCEIPRLNVNESLKGDDLIEAIENLKEM